ncbi:nucleotidyltransferase domain-containing protein [Calidifontibacter terrae]
MGGWGIDALIGRQTRAHHDLDLLVAVDDLPALHAWLRDQGFARAYEWEENQPVQVGARPWDTAFVERHSDGRELDVHAVHPKRPTALLATTDPWDLPPDTLSGTGRIGGRDVRCVSPSGQHAMHVGYALPDRHRADLRELDGW